MSRRNGKLRIIGRKGTAAQAWRRYSTSVGRDSVEP
jgi:predicted RNA-binding protein YlqC (UPF0109 family)